MTPIAVGDKEFVMRTEATPGARAMGRKAFENDTDYVLEEPQNPYHLDFAPENSPLRLFLASLIIKHKHIAWSDKRYEAQSAL